MADRPLNHNSEKKIVEVKIDAMAFGGKGIARHNGKVCFVENALEGDLVKVEILSETQRFSEGRVDTVLESSPFRGSSPCAVSRECGGCQWQGVDYSRQLIWKTQFLKQSLSRIGKFSDELEVETVPSSLENGYRNRILLKARIMTSGKLVVGYFRQSSRDFIAISDCAIASPRLNEFIHKLNGLSFGSSFQKIPLQREIRFRIELQDLPIRHAHEKNLLVTVFEPDQPVIEVEAIIKKISMLEGVAWIGAAKELPRAPYFEFETDMGLLFHTSPGLFQQVNMGLNHVVRRLVKDTVEKYNGKKILDLFCGSGNLSLPLAETGRVIDGVEFSKRAIELAKFNVEKARLKNIDYFAGDTEKYLLNLVRQKAIYDIIIADPPRDGMIDSIPHILALNPSHIIYLSCDPTTLARDLNLLCKEKFSVARMIALDFFPNTYHVECFAVLNRRS